jgi:protein-S-isoprenylcysteine O-methyltransferase Ste14
MRRSTAAFGSAVFFVIAPCVVAGVVPWLITGWSVRDPNPLWAPLRVVGAALVVAGVGALVQSFARFVVEGAGTPLPVAPTQTLVIGGLYRHVRNPMYVAIVSSVVGQALLLGQLVLLLYAALVATIFALFVKGYEEPTLRRQFGDQYEAYRRAVPAWLPRVTPWKPPGS